MTDMVMDHLVVRVPDLARGIANFTELGFHVSPGGDHGITENALIVFKDGTYIELLAPKPDVSVLPPATSDLDDMGRRWMGWLSRSPGAIDWCVGVADIDAVLAAWSHPSPPSSFSRDFKRQRPDGAVARWRLGSPEDMDLPFLITDTTDRAIRVPPPPLPHPNGAEGMRKIWLGVADPIAARHRFNRLFKRWPSDGADPDTYNVSGVEIALVDSDHHAGKFALTLNGSTTGPRELDHGRSFGITISLEPR